MSDAWVCPECGVDYGTLHPPFAINTIKSFPRRYTEALAPASPTEDNEKVIRTRPAEGVWSALEYTAHVADLMRRSSRRSSSACTTRTIPTIDVRGPRPAGDQREVERAVKGRDCWRKLKTGADDLIKQAERVDADGWKRMAKFEWGDRDILTMLQNAVHEGVHHLHDIENGLAKVPRRQRPDAARAFAAFADRGTCHHERRVGKRGSEDTGARHRGRRARLRSRRRHGTRRRARDGQGRRDDATDPRSSSIRARRSASPIGNVRVPVFTGNTVELGFPEGGEIRGDGPRRRSRSRPAAPRCCTATATDTRVKVTSSAARTVDHNVDVHRDRRQRPAPSQPPRHAVPTQRGGAQPDPLTGTTTATTRVDDDHDDTSAVLQRPGDRRARRGDGRVVGERRAAAVTAASSRPRPSPRACDFVNQVNVETYLRGMGEVRNPSWPTASLRAQAIASRTYALRAMAANGELCDTQRCQVYIGSDAEYSAMDKAVADDQRPGRHVRQIPGVGGLFGQWRRAFSDSPRRLRPARHVLPVPAGGSVSERRPGAVDHHDRPGRRRPPAALPRRADVGRRRRARPVRTRARSCGSRARPAALR